MSAVVVGGMPRSALMFQRLLVSNLFRRRLDFVGCCRRRAMSEYREYREPLSGKTTAISLAAFTALSGYFIYKNFKSDKNSSKAVVHAKESNGNNSVATKQQQSAREVRFLSFASVEYDGNIYMTPQDFLESIVQGSPRPRAARKTLRQGEVENFLKGTPSHKKGSTHLFRNLFDKGIISYTEYLFLLCVITKPKSGFQIAFQMFDLDGNHKVDKKEFLVLEHLMASGSSHGASVNEKESNSSLGNTSITVHFFGFHGNDVLKYDDFHRFMENLQTEVLEQEFNQFAHGAQTITEEEFAKVLLRYTLLSKDRREVYIERLKKRIPHSQGIKFEDFKEFCQFLNNLDDFSLAMRMYTYSNHPISEVEFQRAVKACIGKSLNPHLIHVVFQLFDVDGDGKLSHHEFISVMRERVHRGARPLRQSRWDRYKSCIRSEMRAS